MAAIIKVDKLDPQSGTALEIGTSGDTFTVPSGATFENLGTATGFAAISWQAVTTGSTLTAVAGNGYPINTTSNTCTITLPASASTGDQIIFLDYARTWGTYQIILDSNGLNYQGQDDTFTVEYSTDGETLNIVYVDATKGWIPLDDDAVEDVPYSSSQKGIFAFGGGDGGITNISNLVTSSGVFGADVTGVGTARQALAAATYGYDKAIFGYGTTGSVSSLTNLVNNSGVVASDVTGVGTEREWLAAAVYGGDKVIFAYGWTGSGSSLSNLVNNSGVVATDVTGVGTARGYLSAAGYGTDKAIFAYGKTGSYQNVSNLVTNVGVIGSDVSGVGTARSGVHAASYGGDKAIYAFGYAFHSATAVSNLVNSSGVVASDTSGVGTARGELAAASYGGDKAIFAYGNSGSDVSMSNLVNSSGVVASDVSGVGTARNALAAAGYSYSA